jgi:threonine dehydrogenase-like Zn-dependent dehydrogenase
MATTTGRLAAFYGAGKRIEIKEYPVPDPEPGAALVKISLANVCGSDLHSWRGDIDYAKRGRLARSCGQAAGAAFGACVAAPSPVLGRAGGPRRHAV